MSESKITPPTPCPPGVLALVEKFHEHVDAYKAGRYNETQLRREFVVPFFEALGWDITNKAGLAEAYKNVIHEDAVKIGGATKAPDYSCRVSGTRKFFLENPAQVRRYSIDKPSAYIKYGDWLTRSREKRFFSEPKILFHRLRKKLPHQLIGCVEFTGAVNRHSLLNLILRPGNDHSMLMAVLGLFSSNLANRWFVKKYGVLMEVGGFKVGKLPLSEKWNENSDKLSRVVDQMLSLNKQLSTAKTDHEKTALQRQIDATDRQIDQLVYELYGLMEEEIGIMEGTRQ